MSDSKHRLPNISAMTSTAGRARLPMAAALTLAACFWLWCTPGSIHAQSEQHNVWPFAGFSDAEIADHVDNRAEMLAINRLTGRAFITLASDDGQSRRVELALGALDPVGGEVLPVIPVRPTRAEALRDMAHYEGYRQYGVIPVLFYRDAGIIWPTAINPQTAPRIMAVYERAMGAARADERATRDAFVAVALWYTGARVPGQVRPNKPSAQPAPSARPATSPAPATNARPAANPTPPANARPPVAAPPAPSRAWSLAPVKRGLAIEKALGANLGKTFPVVDRFHKGLVTSIKSLDLGAKSYQNTRQLTSTVKRYIDKVAKFKNGMRGGHVIKESQITSRALDLAIPHLGTPAQRTALQKLVAYGKSKGVTVNIIVFP